MKKMKQIICFVLCGVLLLNQAKFTVNATEEQENESIQVNACIQFTAEEAAEYAESIQEAVDSTAEELENEIILSDDEYKVDLLEDYLDEIENVDSNDMFIEQSDGTYDVIIPLDNVDMLVDGELVSTDENGEINDEDIDLDISDIEEEDIVLGEGYDDFEVEVNENEDGLEYNVKVSFDEFSEGIEEMAEEMNDSKAQTKCKFYSKKKVGKSFGAGAGLCYVVYDTNIVNCNKCDGSATKKYTVKEFALKNSDCSKSVKLGLVALADRSYLGLVRYYYRYSKYCVQEGMASLADSKEKNAYCNWKKKSNGHVNCSWFNGIGHSEAFHTHVY